MRKTPTTTPMGIRASMEAPYIGILEICRGPNNLFDFQVMRELCDALDQLTEAGARAVLLCSEGKNFCAGADLRGHNNLEQGHHVYDEALRLFERSVPVVAAVQGGAIGGGFGLALAADFRVCSDTAWFKANFVRLGLHHGFGMSVTLPAAVGSHRALELLTTGRTVAAAEAAATGLCDRVVPSTELRAAATSYVEEIATGAPLAIAAIRSTMLSGTTSQVSEAMAQEAREQLLLMTTYDFKEGVRAIRDRRQPVFEGH